MRSKKLLTPFMGLSQLHALPLSARHSILRSHHISQPAERTSSSSRPLLLLTYLRQHQHRFSSSTTTGPLRSEQPLVPPPREGSGPLLSRRADRALPDLPRPLVSVWLKTLPLFVFLVTVSSLAIFNYEKSTSSTVSSILYALRTNTHARDLLGDEIYFASQVPWIRGELAPMQGVIDISFKVKGTKGTATTKFVSVRSKARGGYFETVEWSLKMDGSGEVVQLLEEEGAKDPLEGTRFD